MKKVILPVILIAALAGFAGAQTTTKKPAAKTTKVVCAVMGGKPIDIAKATKAGMFADYKGRRYFFCCAGCPEEFKKDPAKFAKTATSIPTPKSTKAAK